MLWDDLNYEREFAFIPRDVYATVPNADLACRRFRSTGGANWNADGLVIGTVQKTGNLLRSGVRVFNVRGRQIACSARFTRGVAGESAVDRAHGRRTIYQTAAGAEGRRARAS